jgi:hypothetical protein
LFKMEQPLCIHRCVSRAKPRRKERLPRNFRCDAAERPCIMQWRRFTLAGRPHAITKPLDGWTYQQVIPTTSRTAPKVSPKRIRQLLCNALTPAPPKRQLRRT